MHGILKTLDEVLEVGDPSLEGVERILRADRGGRAGLFFGGGGSAPNLPDPRDEALALT